MLDREASLPSPAGSGMVCCVTQLDCAPLGMKRAAQGPRRPEGIFRSRRILAVEQKRPGRNSHGR
jgi:hypothetical protein